MKCYGPECDRKAVVTGLCKSHYSQQYKGLPLTPLLPRRTRPVVQEGYAFCNGCEEIKQVEKFYKRPNGALHSKCKTCHSRQSNEIQKRKRNAA